MSKSFSCHHRICGKEKLGIILEGGKTEALFI